MLEDRTMQRPSDASSLMKLGSRDVSINIEITWRALLLPLRAQTLTAAIVTQAGDWGAPGRAPEE